MPRAATDKQHAFLASLLRDRVHTLDPAMVARDVMANGAPAASRFIDLLLSCPRKPKAPRANVAMPEDGWYRFEGRDGTPYVVVKHNREGTRQYAQRLHLEGGIPADYTPHPDEDVSEGDFPPVRGTWVYESGLITRLALALASGDAARLTVDEARSFGQLYGVCCVCGRRLTHPRSIEDGIGPVCSGRLDDTVDVPARVGDEVRDGIW